MNDDEVPPKLRLISKEEFAAKLQEQEKQGEKKHLNGHAVDPPSGFYETLDREDAEREEASRIPPHDIDAEAAVLNWVMCADALPRVQPLLRPQHFYSEAHRRIYEACEQLSSADTHIDLVTVASQLKNTDRFGQVGGMPYLVEISTSAPAGGSVLTYAKTVRALAHRRELLLACQESSATLYIQAVSPIAVAARLRSVIEFTEEDLPQDQKTSEVFAELPPVPYLVPELGIAPGPPVLVAGYGFSGKTVALQAMALAIASGVTIWGQWTCKHGRVLHIDYEQGRHLTFERYQRLAFGMGVTLQDIDNRLETSIMPKTFLDGPAAESMLARLGQDRALIIIDSLRAACPSMEENSSESRAILDAAARASEKTGCVYAFIHHARKPSEDNVGGAKYSIRGSSALFDGSGSVFTLSGSKGEPSLVQHEKCKWKGVTVDPFGLSVEDVEGGKGPRTGLLVRFVQGEKVTPEPTSRAEEREQAMEAKRSAKEELAAQRAERAAQETRDKASAIDKGVLEALKTHPFTNFRALKALMVAKLEGCSQERLYESLARLETTVLTKKDGNSTLYYLVGQTRKKDDTNEQ